VVEVEVATAVDTEAGSRKAPTAKAGSLGDLETRLQVLHVPWVRAFVLSCDGPWGIGRWVRSMHHSNLEVSGSPGGTQGATLGATPPKASANAPATLNIVG
jgi:hypothetical protein